MITERGLTLSPMMARATLRAKAPKTMTRRIMKNQPAGESLGLVQVRACGQGFQWYGDAGESSIFYCPYGAPGERLYGREAWRTLAMYDHLPPRDVPRTAPIWYEADSAAPPGLGRYRHGRFMMRWMSRIVREITDVRVERLDKISEADALREGIEKENLIVGAECYGGRHTELTDDRFFIPGMSNEQQEPGDIPGFDSATAAFFRLWEILHGPGSVDTNPWLWVISYRPIPTS